jgi:hypothetical protein
MNKDTAIDLPYVELADFNQKVVEFAKTNMVLTNVFNHPKSKIKTWEDLPPHLIQDLFQKVGCKPLIQKY